MELSAAQVIERFGLVRHPEGGWYREMWRHEPGDGSRGAGTAIYFLLEQGNRSHWHRVDADEIWHHYAGSPLLLRLWAEGEARISEQHLGSDLAEGQEPQLRVPAGVWQSAEPVGAWALMGCTVSPAFEFAGFELASVGWEPPAAAAGG
jgi:uncharacterized protein